MKIQMAIQHGVLFVFCQHLSTSIRTMTTDEATKNEGEGQAAALAEQGEDITPNQDRGVLKVRPSVKLMAHLNIYSADLVTLEHIHTR